MSDHYTTFKLIDHAIGKIKTVIELPNGLFLSPILYLFYNNDLIEVCTKLDNGTVALGFIDKVAILEVGGSVEKKLY